MNRVINIAFFIKGLRIGGTERVLVSYIKELSKDNRYNITLIINENSSRNVLLEEIPSNVAIEYVYTKSFDNYLHDISIKRKESILAKGIYSLILPYGKSLRRKKVKDIIERKKIDILVDFERSFVKYAEEFTCKKIIWNHFTFSKNNSCKEWKEKFDKYDRVIAISKEMEEEILAFYPKPEKVKMLYNPQHIEKVQSRMNEIDNFSEEDKLLLEQDYILYVGRIETIKGLPDLIESYNLAKSRGVKEKLYIIGSGTEESNLKSKVEELGMTNDILFLGSKDNPFPWMKNAKLFVTTTYGEGLPTTYIESMICGTPILSYDCPTGPKDILENGKYGVLVPMGDKEKFSEELYSLLKSSEKIDSYKEILGEKIEDFNVKNIIYKFKDIINNIG